MNPERPFSSGQPEFAIIGMARMFVGHEFPNNRLGFAAAMALLREQHDRTLPPAPTRTRLQQVVAQEDLVITVTEQFAALALDQDDWETALMGANHLYAYGDTDLKDALGGRTFALSLQHHRALAERIQARFTATDRYLSGIGVPMAAEIEELRARGDTQRELELVRGLIHIVALNGTLGEEAKRQFDPFAVFNIEK